MSKKTDIAGGTIPLRSKRRDEDEYKATEWALRKCLEMHLIPNRDFVVSKQISINRMYDREAARFRDFDLYGLKRPDWLKSREHYSVVRLYDELFPEQRKKGCYAATLYPR